MVYPVRSMQDVRQEIIEQLRQVWNARGAADLAIAIDVSQHSVQPANDVFVLTREIKALDR